MKNLILRITLGFLLLTGCSTDESFESMEEQTTNSIYVLEQNTDQSTFRTIDIDNLQSSPNNFDFIRTDNSIGHTSGLFIPTKNNATVLSWSAYKDESGTYGTAELQIATRTYSMHLMMEAECIMIEDNEAVYGAIITQVVELKGDAPLLSEMWRFYFKVKDINNGLDFDQISNKWIFASPRSQSFCSIYTPSHPIWSSEEYTNVMKPGFVKVSN
ncbi:MAG: hypothetical protein JXR05_15535 [Flavobacteriaceae bacterium]